MAQHLHTNTTLRNAWASLARFARRRAGWIFVVAVVVGMFGANRARSLVIDQDLRALIPDTYQSVVRLESLSERIGSQSELIVEIKCNDRDQAIQFGKALASKMRSLKDSFRHVEFQREVSWFKTNALLFMPIHKLLRLRAKIVKRIRDEVENEVVEQLDDDEPAKSSAENDSEDPLDLDDDTLKKRYGEQYDVPREYLETSDGDVVIMVVRATPTKPTTNVKFTQRLVKQTEELLVSLKPASFHPTLVAKIRGEYAKRSRQVSGMRSDLLDSSLYALLMLLCVIVIYFKRLRAVVLVLVPLVLSILLTVGISTLIFEALNLVTAFIFVVLLGLGIDFGIHLLSRYECERMRGLEQEAALVESFTNTGVDVAMGALTTAAMFSLFPIADFKGFSQFGVVACIGVLTALLFTLTVLPALIVLVERIRPWTPRAWIKQKESKARQESPLFGRPLAWVVIVVGLGLGGAGLSAINAIEFEYDFTRLGKKKPKSTSTAKKPKKKPKTYSDAIGRPDLGPALLLSNTPKEGMLVESQLRGIKMLTDYQLEKILGAPLDKSDIKGNNPHPDDLNPPELDIDEFDEEEDEDDPFAKPTMSAADKQISALADEVKRQDVSPDTALVLKTYEIDRIRFMRSHLYKWLSAWSFVPARQEDKLVIIADMRKRIDAKYEDMSEDAKEKADRFRQYLTVKKPVTLESIPLWVLNRWTDTSGQAGRHAVVWNRGSKLDYTFGKQLYNAWFNLDVGPSGEVSVPVAANYFVLSEIVDALKRDGPRVLVASLLAILVCLLIMFRSLRLTALILVPLCVAMMWLTGVFYLLGWKINLYNVITFALIVGMGVDDGIHMVARWTEEGQSSVGVMVRETGSAVFLTTVSTCIGFGGLLFANHIGLSTLGWTAASGMVLCLIASVTVLPALLYVLGKKRSQSSATDPA